jgi:hypothetical protein
MKNFMTFAQLDSLCLKEAAINENQLWLPQRQFIVNNKLMKVYALLDGLNDPFYNMSTALTVAADIEQLHDATTNGGIITGITAATNTITRSSGSFPAGALIHVWICDSGATVATFTARISVAGATATYVIIAGADANLAAYECVVFVQKTLSVTTVDLSTLYFNRIEKVYDDQGTGSADRVFKEIKDPVIFSDLWRDPLFDKIVAWNLRGSTLQLGVGPSATAIGTATMEYRGKPNLWTDATPSNEILIPPEHNQMLQDEVVALYLTYTNQPVPEKLAGRLERYATMYQAASADKIKAMEVKGQRA